MAADRPICDRRRFLLAGASALLASELLCGGDDYPMPMPAAAFDRPMIPLHLTRSDFLTDLRRRCYAYFVEAADPVTGLVSDRGRADGTGFSQHSSVAACGFALAAHGAMATAGLADRREASDRAERLLRSLVDVVQHEHGYLYHFVDRRSGRRMLQCEASSIDTALAVAGALHAKETFTESDQIATLAERLYQRVRWDWLLGDDLCLSMGWKPECGRLPYYWDRFSELTILVLLAIAAPRHAIPPSCWHAWRRGDVLHHHGEAFLSYPPLFVQQYPLAFIDFRGTVSDDGWDFFRNSQIAHLAQIEFQHHLGGKYPSLLGHYGTDVWGLTSSDSATGYRDWGGPYVDGVVEPARGIDGTVVPSAAAGGLAIVPEEALHTLQYQRQHYGDRIYGRYGFVNAYNPITGWIGPDVIGIDTGISLLMAENLVSGQVWQAFMNHQAARRAMHLCGFQSVVSA